jgi:hypothetical protein
MYGAGRALHPPDFDVEPADIVVQDLHFCKPNFIIFCRLTLIRSYDWPWPAEFKFEETRVS